MSPHIASFADESSTRVVKPAVTAAPVSIPSSALVSNDLRVGSAALKRKEILESFHETYTLYEDLFSIIEPSALYKRADSLRHPLIFYYGHTAVLYINKLVLAKLIPQTARINHKIEATLATGVDEMAWDDLLPEHYDWPSADAVREYRNSVRKLVSNLIETLPLEDNTVIGWEHDFWPILMGIEHERIHLETSSVLIRQLPVSDLRPHARFVACPTWKSNPELVSVNPLIPVAGAEILLGRNEADVSKPIYYGWDNEYGKHKASVHEFKASQKLISNAEFLAFVKDGGYQNTSYWTEEGLGWLSFTQARHPRFWIETSDGQYVQRNMVGITDSMPWDWPVEVNYLEAKAYCNWYSAKTSQPVRLPSEDEWNLLRNVHAPRHGDEVANLGLRGWSSSTPVDMYRHGDFYDVVGNVWQWTETPIYPFEGFRYHPLYDDFTTPTYDNRHNLIKGGSWISTGNEQIAHSRYAFRRHFYQHAGFRIVVSDAKVDAPESLKNPYETDELVTLYQEFHYGPQTRIPVEPFPVAIAKLCEEVTRDYPEHRNRVLDLGCAVGRSTFELARWFKQAVGVDFSARFIDVGVQMQTQKRIRYAVRTEGDLRDLREVGLLEDLHITDDLAERVSFIQGDACNLKDIPTLRNFDVILAANLIDRLNDPERFLTTIGDRIVPGGFLIILSPYTWLEEYTPREKWIGGRKQTGTGETIKTFDGLRDILTANGYEFVRGPFDIPFVIRETQRKYQHSFSEVSIYRRLQLS